MLVVMLTIPDPTYGSFRQEGGEIRVMKVVFVFFCPTQTKTRLAPGYVLRNGILVPERYVR